MKRTLIGICLLAFASSANALPSYLDQFVKTYKVSKNSKLAKARCALCHSSADGGDDRNAYGLSLEEALKSAKEHKVTDTILEKVGKLESPVKGVRYVERIRADQLPCPPKSKS